MQEYSAQNSHDTRSSNSIHQIHRVAPSHKLNTDQLPQQVSISQWTFTYNNLCYRNAYQWPLHPKKKVQNWLFKLKISQLRPFSLHNILVTCTDIAECLKHTWPVIFI